MAETSIPGAVLAPGAVPDHRTVPAVLDSYELHNDGETNMPGVQDNELDQITIGQMTWKPGVSREVACRIVAEAVRRGLVWPDEIDMSGIHTDDKNVIGITWRNLARYGLVLGTGRWRKSTKAKGRKIFQYQVGSLELARTFLSRNGQQLNNINQQLLLI